MTKWQERRDKILQDFKSKGKTFHCTLKVRDTIYENIIYDGDKLSVMDNTEFEELYDRNVYE